VFRHIRSKLLAAFAVPIAIMVAVVTIALSGQSNDQSSNAMEHAAPLVALSLAAVLLGILLLGRVSRSVSRPLADLAQQADRLATGTLPATVQAILDGSSAGEPLDAPAVTVKGVEEVTRLAASLESLNTTAIELAAGQASLRRNLADAFVNLGRRNQNLVTRQLEYITEIELNELDPASLDDLFRLDHLATRMRRNAESLLVLAGSGTARQWSSAVPVMDVARAASAEVENYQRLRLRHFDPATVSGAVTTDLVHLLAELIENALTFSPPGSPVDIYGRSVQGTYLIVVVDSGIGMQTEELETANHRLEGLGADGDVPGRYLGHFVAGRLAARHGIAVSLQNSESGGLVARVKIPAAVVQEIDEAVLDLSAVAEVQPLRPEAGDEPVVALQGDGPVELAHTGEDADPGPGLLGLPSAGLTGGLFAPSFAGFAGAAEEADFGPAVEADVSVATVPAEAAPAEAVPAEAAPADDVAEDGAGDKPLVGDEDGLEVPNDEGPGDANGIAGAEPGQVPAWSALLKYSEPVGSCTNLDARANRAWTASSLTELSTTSLSSALASDGGSPFRSGPPVAAPPAELADDSRPAEAMTPIAPVVPVPSLMINEVNEVRDEILAAGGNAARARNTADALRKLTRRVPGAALADEDGSLRRPTPTSTTDSPLGLTSAMSQYLVVTAGESRAEKEQCA
jgi:signal transduction histidine kinase